MERKNISRRDPPKKPVTSGYTVPRPGNHSTTEGRELDILHCVIIVDQTDFDSRRSSTGRKQSIESGQYASN